MGRIIRAYNSSHLGDQIFNCILFYRIAPYLEQNDIQIHYACYDKYHDQVAEFIMTNHIKLLPYSDDIEKECGYHLWMGVNNGFQHNIHSDNFEIDTTLLAVHNEFLEKVNIPIHFDPPMMYTDPDLLVRANRLQREYGNRYQNVDILILNSQPISNQLDYDENAWAQFIIDMQQQYKVVCTTNLPNQPSDVVCTMDDKLTAKDIAALSTMVDYVVGVNSGLVPGMFNSYTLEHVKKFYYFDRQNKYVGFPNFERKTQIKDFDISVFSTKEVESFVNNNNHATIFPSLFLCVLIVLGFVLLWIFTTKYRPLVKRRRR